MEFSTRGTPGPPPFLVFTHIRKTGGSTVQAILHRNLAGYFSPGPPQTRGDRDPSVPWGEPRPLTPAFVSTLARWWPGHLDGVGGHLTPGYVDYRPGHPERAVVHVTLLRRPLERYMSHLNHRLRAAGSAWTVDAFLRCTSFHDRQTRQLAGARDLDAAKAAANCMSLVGLLERFDETLVLLKGLLGRETFDLRYTRVNTRPLSRPFVTLQDLSSSDQARVMEANQLDLALYDYAVATCFPRAVQAYGTDRLAADVATLRDALPTYRPRPWSRAKQVVSNRAIGLALRFL